MLSSDCSGNALPSNADRPGCGRYGFIDFARIQAHNRDPSLSHSLRVFCFPLRGGAGQADCGGILLTPLGRRTGPTNDSGHLLPVRCGRPQAAYSFGLVVLPSSSTASDKPLSKTLLPFGSVGPYITFPHDVVSQGFGDRENRGGLPCVEGLFVEDEENGLQNERRLAVKIPRVLQLVVDVPLGGMVQNSAVLVETSLDVARLPNADRVKPSVHAPNIADDTTDYFPDFVHIGSSFAAILASYFSGENECPSESNTTAPSTRWGLPLISV